MRPSRQDQSKSPYLKKDLTRIGIYSYIIMALLAIFGDKRSFQSIQYTTNKQQSQAFFYFLWISASFYEKKIQKKPTIEGLGKKISAILLERGVKRVWIGYPLCQAVI